MDIDKLLNNRWSERNRDLNEKILKSQEEMSKRGLLQSTLAVKSLHDIFADEFSSSRQVIVRAIIDSRQLGPAGIDRKAHESWAIDQLRQRQKYLDSYFRERVGISADALQNRSMIAPFMNVAQYLEPAEQELCIEVNWAIDEFESSLGATSYDRVINYIKNQRIGVVLIVSFGLIMAIFGLFSAIQDIVG